MRQPYNPYQIVDTIVETINQVVVLTTNNQPLTVKMRAILDEVIKYCLTKDLKSLIHVRDEIAARKGDNETRDGLLHRLRHILDDERLHEILCGKDPVEWGAFIFRGKSIIFDGFGMGREKMLFIGNLITQGIKNYFRYQRPKEYRPVVLYVDECHNFINQNFFDILKEGRKYKLSAVLATQDFAVIDDRMARVMLNAGNLISFRAGHREAQLFAREMNIPAEDVQSLEKFHAFFLTASAKGMVKTLRPPLFKKLKVHIRPVNQKPMKKPEWFPLQPYHPHETTNSEAVPADALVAETVPSRTLDG